MTISEYLGNNTYPGRCILAGTAPTGESVLAYAIMGRSEQSRNRIFTLSEDGTLKTEPFDASLLADPSLIIYNALRKVNGKIILTNGDQTDTIADALLAGKEWEAALVTREYEPDAPNYTPRISVLLSEDGSPSFSILKREDGKCARYVYRYGKEAGICHLIHTYEENGTPLPSFTGLPRRFTFTEEIDTLPQLLWDHLNAENRISLYVRIGDRETIINKHQSHEEA